MGSLRSFATSHQSTSQKNLSNLDKRSLLSIPTFQKLNQNLWSIRINREYRALALKEGDDYYWFWIGLHDEYDRLIDEI